MAIVKQCGRQYPLAATVEVALVDLQSGVAAGAIELPSNAEVVGGHVVVKEGFDSVGSDALAVGDAAQPGRYLAAGDLQATGRIALVPTGYRTSSREDVAVTWASGGGTPSAGAFTLVLQYLIHGRDNEVQG